VKIPPRFEHILIDDVDDVCLYCAGGYYFKVTVVYCHCLTRSLLLFSAIRFIFFNNNFAVPQSSLDDRYFFYPKVLDTHGTWHVTVNLGWKQIFPTTTSLRCVHTRASILLFRTQISFHREQA